MDIIFQSQDVYEIHGFFSENCKQTAENTMNDVISYYSQTHFGFATNAFRFCSFSVKAFYFWLFSNGVHKYSALQKIDLHAWLSDWQRVI